MRTLKQMVLVLLLLHTVPGSADSDEFTINPGLNDAWFNPATGGQGFFITVYPDIGQVFLAWFTYDTVRPPEDTGAMLGDPGHRWLTAQGPYSGASAELTVFVSKGGIFDGSEPAADTDPSGDGAITLEFADCTAGMISYEITSLGITGEIPIQRVQPDNQALCETLATGGQLACTRPEPDRSHGPNNPPVINRQIIPFVEIVDGGPGVDGIPALEQPEFLTNPTTGSLGANDLVVGVKIGDDIRAYPHDILNWHEIVNEQFAMDGEMRGASLSYCPLTGSAVMWKSTPNSADQTFGTSGTLYNSNLVLYDRETQTVWSQMLEQAIRGERVAEIPEKLQVVETSWATWYAMYPGTRLLSRNTGYSRDYDEYPYGTFREDHSVLFPADNQEDTRLHRKTRVLGLNVGDVSRVWPIRNFTGGVEILNESVGGMHVVVAGSSELNIGVVYNRQLEDCTVLEFEAVQDSLPLVMRDTEGNGWDVFGQALEGPRAGQRLQKTNSYIAYWYAWTAFFHGASIYQ